MLHGPAAECSEHGSSSSYPLGPEEEAAAHTDLHVKSSPRYERLCQKQDAPPPFFFAFPNLLVRSALCYGRTGEARVHSGEVLAWCEEKARHHVLYDDGEDEWLDLGAERLVWHKPGSRPAVAAGLPEGASTDSHAGQRSLLLTCRSLVRSTRLAVVSCRVR